MSQNNGKKEEENNIEDRRNLFINENFLISIEGDVHVKKTSRGWKFDLTQDRVLDWGSILCLKCNSEINETNNNETYMDVIYRHISENHTDLIGINDKLDKRIA